MNRNSRRGFTLVELLVVIGIIGVLAAILLPAVQAAREAARRTQCLSQLGQLGKATMSYETSKKRYPGYETIMATRSGVQFNDSSGANKPATWAVELLPQMGEQPLYDRWNDPRIPLFISGEYNPALVTRVDFMICPSSGTREPDTPGNSYVANAGFFPRPTDPAPLNNLDVTDPASYWWKSQRAANGVFHSRIPWVSILSNGSTRQPKPDDVSMTDVHDGVTNTLMLSERLPYADDDSAGEWQRSGLSDNVPTSIVEGKMQTCFSWIYVQDGSVPVEPNPNITGNPTLPPQVPPTREMLINGNRKDANFGLDTLRPSSAHSGGVNAVFMDASTKFLSEEIDYHVYQSLMTPHNKRSDMPFRSYVLKDSDLSP